MENLADILEKRPLIVHSFRRSSLRKKVAEYLYDISPSPSYPSEIAYHVKSNPTNVIGALRGMEPRYRKEESLLHLNIVEVCKSDGNLTLYRLTDFGKKIISSLKEKS
ncbi:MAG TPA: hypothetical protein ENG60_03150 [Thermoplasmatales archaeon]|mgnify:FL=1|nr:hypothetical protein [Thermoplasmatales archaeon]HEX17392.1 hypothetical protein [Thermoplasmatales archaeon]